MEVGNPISQTIQSFLERGYQLDAILTYAKKVGIVPVKDNGNQKPFETIIVMKYECPGIGIVKMTVGVRRGNHEKVQYCITAIEG